MEKVLYDLHRADGILQTSGIYYRQDGELNSYYLSVMEKNGITQAQFDSSLVWYTDNPQIFNKIYPRVISRLEKERQELIRVQGDRSVFVREEFVPLRIDTLLAPVLFYEYVWEFDIVERLNSQAASSAASDVNEGLLPCILPPRDTLVGTLGTGGVVLEVGEHRSVDTDVKRVGFIRSEGNKTGGHRPAMQVP